ncbi:hypothetical protein B9Z19DRAFT_1095243, partial [Tuber borchii]
KKAGRKGNTTSRPQDKRKICKCHSDPFFIVLVIGTWADPFPCFIGIKEPFV